MARRISSPPLSRTICNSPSDAVFFDESEEFNFRRRRATIARKVQHRLSVFAGKLNGLLGTARQILPDGKDNRAVGIPGIPFRALDVIRTGRLLQLLSGVNRAVLGPPAFRAPATVRDSMLDGEIERGAVSTGLAPRHDFRNTTHKHCLHERLGGRRSQNGGLGSFNFTKATEENNGENLRVLQDVSRAAKRAETGKNFGSIRNRIRDGVSSLAGPQPYAP